MSNHPKNLFVLFMFLAKEAKIFEYIKTCKQGDFFSLPKDLSNLIDPEEKKPSVMSLKVALNRFLQARLIKELTDVSDINQQQRFEVLFDPEQIKVRLIKRRTLIDLSENQFNFLQALYQWDFDHSLFNSDLPSDWSNVLAEKCCDPDADEDYEKFVEPGNEAQVVFKLEQENDIGICHAFFSQFEVRGCKPSEFFADHEVEIKDPLRSLPAQTIVESAIPDPPNKQAVINQSTFEPVEDLAARPGPKSISQDLIESLLAQISLEQKAMLKKIQLLAQLRKAEQTALREKICLMSKQNEEFNEQLKQVLSLIEKLNKEIKECESTAEWCKQETVEIDEIKQSVSVMLTNS